MNTKNNIFVSLDLIVKNKIVAKITIIIVIVIIIDRLSDICYNNGLIPRFHSGYNLMLDNNSKLHNDC